jgi:GH15 family glucan-1,4-alpha-glucosidase
MARPRWLDLNESTISSLWQTSSGTQANTLLMKTQRLTHWRFWGGIAASLAAISWLIFVAGRFFIGVLRQPHLQPLALLSEETPHEKTERKAYRIAAANLRQSLERRRLHNGHTKLVLCAGVRNFREPWARDFGFASFGLLDEGGFRACRETLEAFFDYQLPNGQFPVKMTSTSILARYVHSLLGRQQPINQPIRPKYVTGHRTISLDGNALLIVATLNYIRRSNDLDFARRHWPNLTLAARWLASHAGDDFLLHQAPFADWADSIGRQGKVLYTNVCYWKALGEISRSAADLGYDLDAAHFEALTEEVRQAIDDHFWRTDLGYYVTNAVFDNLSSSGNLLAVAWDLTDERRGNQILDRMHEFGLAQPIPTQVVHRAYPDRFVALENRLGGLGHYHTEAAWLWLGCWHVIALLRVGRLAEADELLFRMASVIVRDGAVHEVYDRDGTPLSTRWYSSEAPLTWSAAMVVHAWHVLAETMELTPVTKTTGRETKC